LDGNDFGHHHRYKVGITIPLRGGGWKRAKILYFPSPMCPEKEEEEENRVSVHMGSNTFTHRYLHVSTYPMIVVSVDAQRLYQLGRGNIRGKNEQIRGYI
jgi:hypothetical protein